jgi:hypothetical protein
MSKGVYGAFGLVLLWLAFVALFVAFHPGGLRSELFKDTNNPNGLARNPRDVVLYFVNKWTSGEPPQIGPNTV